MNYLGHLYFSYDDVELMHANLFGDFVKGSNLDRYTSQVKQGILLHRQIDSYIDQHPTVKQLVLALYPALPKVAPVAVDIYFDHFLSVYWKEFHHESLINFLTRFYTHTINDIHFPDDHFLYVIRRIKNEQWLSSYADTSVIKQVCIGVSKRISFPNALVLGGTVLNDHYQMIERAFFSFMDDARKHFSY